MLPALAAAPAWAARSCASFESLTPSFAFFARPVFAGLRHEAFELRERFGGQLLVLVGDGEPEIFLRVRRVVHPLLVRSRVRGLCGGKCREQHDD